MNSLRIPNDVAGMTVLVHGLFADRSSWFEVIARLEAAGLNATAVQNPLTALPDAVASAKRVLARQDGPTVLVGHSFYGMIVSGRYTFECVGSGLCVGSSLCGGASDGCGRGLHGVGEEIS